MSSVTGFDFFLKQVKPELQDITGYFFTSVFDRYQDTVKRLQAYLVQAARQYPDEKEKALYITALEQIQRFQPQMINAFAFHLLESLQIMTGETTGQMNGAQVQNTFNALAQHGREDELYLKNITEQCIEHNSAALASLRQALQQALGLSIDSITSPFNPVFICNALSSSLRLQQLHSRVKREIIVLFEESLLNPLDGIYTNLVQQFERLGFNGKTTAQRDMQTEAMDIIDSDFNELLLNGTIASQWSATVYLPMQKSGGTIMAAKALDQLLESLQKGYDPQTDGLLIDHIKDRLAIDAGNGKMPVLALRDENLINLASLLFRQIADNTDSRTGDLFLRLSVPFTRLMLNDELFFHDRNHPARRMLGKLIQLVHSNPDDTLAFKHMQLYTTRLLMRYQGDTAIFNELSRDIDERLAQYQPVREPDLDSITRLLKEEEKNQLIDKAIAVLVNKQTEKLSRKLRFHLLLDIFLQQIFTGIYHKAGKDSVEWKNALHFTQSLIPVLDNSDKAAFAAASKKLADTVKTLNRYLTDAGISLEWRRSFFDQMQEIHILLSRGNNLKQLDDDQLKHTQAIDIIIDHYESERAAQLFETTIIGHEHNKRSKPISHTQDSNTALSTVKNLRNGQWINLLIDDRRTPCFISHHTSQRNAYVFCNRQNQKLLERSTQDLQQDFAEGFASLLERTDSFDAALFSTVTRLKKAAH